MSTKKCRSKITGHTFRCALPFFPVRAKKYCSFPDFTPDQELS
jgi:hypothetical protein